MKKKAMAEKTLVLMIIVAVSAILILYLYGYVNMWGAGAVHREVCRRQIEINSASATTQPKIDCPILYVTIKSEPDATATKHRIAQLMADARYAYSAAWTPGKTFFPSANGVFCSVYAVIDFKQKGKYMTNFDRYLAETLISPESSQTFSQYFSSPEEGQLSPFLSESEQAQMQKTQETTLWLTDSKYAVVVMYGKQYTLIERMTNTIGSIATGGAVNFGLPSPAAPTQGRIVTIVGGGVILGVSALVGGLYVGAGALTIAGLAATGAVSGSALTAVGLGTAEFIQDPKTGAGVFLIPYNKEDDLKTIGCEYFPVNLGTRPQ